MLVIVEMRDQTERVNTDGSIDRHQEFLFSDPLEAGRFSITKSSAAELQALADLRGKQCLIGLRRGKTSNGIDYWQVTKSPKPYSQDFKTPPGVIPTKPAF